MALDTKQPKGYRKAWNGEGQQPPAREPDPGADDLLWCPTCRHHHKGAPLGFICVGCPCEKRPPFQRLAL
jgi:hypothetical protein